MWNISMDSNLIQNELGAKAMSAYSSKRNNSGDIFGNGIARLRMLLADKNIALPIVSYSYSKNLAPNEYILFFGATCIRGDYRTQDIIQTIVDYAVEYHLPKYTFDAIENLFRSGIRYLENKKYPEAMSLFQKAYYCSAFDKRTRGIMINSMINICGIQFLNRQNDAALLSGQRACELAFAKDFFDPYLKYHAAEWTGIVLTQQNDWEEARKYFVAAYNAVSKTDSGELAISALSAIVQICMEERDLVSSAAALDKMLDLMQADEIYGSKKDLIIQLARLQANMYRTLFLQCASEYVELSREYHRLLHRFSYKLKEYTLNVVYRYGGMVFGCMMGSFFGGGSSSQNQYSQFGDNIKDSQVVQITEKLS